MRRKTLDTLLSSLGLLLALLLLVGGGLLTWASSFAQGQVHDQLAAQKITMPSGKQLEDPAIKPYLEKYAGQEMTTGEQAKAFADHYIQVHMDKQSGGRTYEEVSGEFMKKSKDPAADQTELKKLGELRQSLFMGNSLRSMLLTAYAFATMGTIARFAAIAAYVGSALMLLLGLLGLRHARRAGDATV
ncbi:hypothetical protein [Arsenicicoccus dermatophilus]|uniref:hypothetical protein n=1 Tax=Arsenicicoccus dermatophilus TaxID=1076331 RepID=UPI001F4CF754|nr:hypothetical protein [Arsenicicoccus dermatophilus]MCH8612952.1 hypothetical protein [Arsenicicoccus dermatophilus]